MSQRQVDPTAEPADLQGESVVLEDVWSSRMYQDVMHGYLDPTVCLPSVAR